MNGYFEEEFLLVIPLKITTLCMTEFVFPFVHLIPQDVCPLTYYLNPVSKHFHLLNASKCLNYAVFFTPQYGDSFIEVGVSREFHS